MTTLRLVHPPVDHAALHMDSRTMHFPTPVHERIFWAYFLHCADEMGEPRALIIDGAGQQWLMKPSGFGLGFQRRRVSINVNTWLRRETLRSGSALFIDARTMLMREVTTPSQPENATHDIAPNHGRRPRILHAV